MDYILCFLIRIFVAASRWSKALARFGLGSYEEWSHGQPVKLLMVGYNGARNTGADARVAAAVQQIRELFGVDDVRITVLTLNEEVLNGYFDDDVSLLKISSIFLKDLYRACSTHHAAVLCEGSTLKSTFANALSLFFCEAAGIMSRQQKPCITFGSEVGYMDAYLKKFAGVMCKDTYFITRTHESQIILDEMGISGHVGTDTAWLYDDEISPSEAEELLRKQGWDGEKPLLGVAVINPFCWPVRASLHKWIRGMLTGKMQGQYDKWYFYSDSPERREAYIHYIDQIARAVDQFCREHDLFPVLLGMEKMDAGPVGDLRQKLGGAGAVFLSGDCSADIMTGILRKLSVLVTSRYHAAVLSMANGCPIIAVSMDERLDSLMKENNLNSVFLHHVRDEDLRHGVLKSLTEGLLHKSELKEYLQKRHLAYQEKQREMGVFLKQYIMGRLDNRGQN